MKTIEIVASYSGTVNTGNYNNESPFFSIKEVIEDWQGTDEEAQERHLELAMECYEKFWEFKEEALRPMVVNHPTPDPKSSVPQLEEIRQKGINLITEQGKWFQDNGFQGEFRGAYQELFKKEFDLDLQKISLTGVRHFNRKLGALQHQLNGKIKEKENGKS